MDSTRIKRVLCHSGLYVGFTLYMSAGAGVLQLLEQSSEVEMLKSARNLLMDKRKLLLEAINNNSSHDSINDMSKTLTEYEVVAQDAVRIGVDLVNMEFNVNWTYTQSLFFSLTILTTIGYGNFAARTWVGRLFCIMFAIVGIPLTLSVLADIGQFIADGMLPVWKRTRAKFDNIFSEPMSGDEEKLISKEGSSSLLRSLLLALVGLLLLTLFLCLEAIFFAIWEPHWTFFESFYFCFITMTTIGLGDFSPTIAGDGRSFYMILSMVFILLGLAITSTVIELIRRQYVESYQKMVEAKERIKSLLQMANLITSLQEEAKTNGDMNAAIAAEMEKLENTIGELKKTTNSKSLQDLQEAYKNKRIMDVLENLTKHSQVTKVVPPSLCRITAIDEISQVESSQCQVDLFEVSNPVELTLTRDYEVVDFAEVDIDPVECGTAIPGVAQDDIVYCLADPNKVYAYDLKLSVGWLKSVFTDAEAPSTGILQVIGHDSRLRDGKKILYHQVHDGRNRTWQIIENSSDVISKPPGAPLRLMNLKPNSIIEILEGALLNGKTISVMRFRVLRVEDKCRNLLDQLEPIGRKWLRMELEAKERACPESEEGIHPHYRSESPTTPTSSNFDFVDVLGHHIQNQDQNCKLQGNININMGEQKTLLCVPSDEGSPRVLFFGTPATLAADTFADDEFPVELEVKSRDRSPRRPRETRSQSVDPRSPDTLGIERPDRLSQSILFRIKQLSNQQPERDAV